VRRGCAVRAAVRSRLELDGVQEQEIGDINNRTDWRNLLRGVRVVIHLAGLAHRFGRDARDDAFWRVNAEGTAKLAADAGRAGVGRLVYLSTAKVCGEQSGVRPFVETDVAPVGAYSESKWAGEQHVRSICAEAALESVIIRTPLVYGPGVRANFLALLRAVDRGIPLPLAGVHNRRSLIFVENLVDALIACAAATNAAGETFLVRDARDVSSADLVREMAAALGRRPRLFAVPTSLLIQLGRVIRRETSVRSLVDTLVVSDARIRSALGWTPPYDLPTGLGRTATWFRAADGRSQLGRGAA
jgi:nucleoside-diphosphate-sugar epimerase